MTAVYSEVEIKNSTYKFEDDRYLFVIFCKTKITKSISFALLLHFKRSIEVKLKPAADVPEDISIHDSGIWRSVQFWNKCQHME